MLVSKRKIVLFLIRLACSIKRKRSCLLLMDAILDPGMELVDNFTLFKFIHENKNDWEAVYVVAAGNPLVNELVAKYGKSILVYDRKSITFWIRFILCLSRSRFWLDGYFLLIGTFKDIGKIIYNSKYVDSVNTQHGVNFFKIGRWERSEGTLGPDVYNYVVASTFSEFDFFTKTLGYEQNRVLRAGLARWDLMHTLPRNQILIFFTWRDAMKNCSSEDVRSSLYFHNFYSLLRDPRLSLLLDKYGYRLKLCLHHVIYEKGLDCLFSDFDCVTPLMVNREKNKSKILITDYSSISFDFIYSCRDVIFYDVDYGDCKFKSSRDLEADDNVKIYLNDRGNYTHSLDRVFELLEIMLQGGNVPNRFSCRFLLKSNYSVCPALLQSLESFT